MIQFFDGAMGTQLQGLGLSTGACPEEWNLTHPEAITEIHRKYIAAGADIIETHTFGGHPLKLAEYGLEDRAEEITAAAVGNAKAAAADSTKIAAAFGPIGQLIEPLGSLSFEAAYQGYHRIIKAAAEAGADLILLETFIDLQEMRAALLAAKDACDLPIFCQMTYEANGRTVTGTDAATAAIVLDALGASVIGANCSLGPEQLLEILKTYQEHTEKPLSVQPNAGLPVLDDQGNTVFPMNPAEMARWIPQLIEAGAHYIGGCCGTTPAHIEEMKAAAKELTPPKTKKKPGLWLTSRSQSVGLGKDHPPRLIGERINPTGRKALAEALRNNDLLAIKREALVQVENGAELLDVNLGVPGLDISSLMGTVITELSSLIDVPLLIDTTEPAPLEAGLRAYPGRALINSVSAEPERIAEFLPLAKKYGAAILCLPLTSSGIPATPEDRLAAARSIYDAALEAGLSENDIALDPLVLPVAADAHATNTTLDTLALFRKALPLPTLMGLSNSSFGLPSRPQLNGTFLPLALMAGLDAPLANPCDETFKTSWDAAKVLLGYDPQGLHWSEAHTVQPAKAENTPSSPADPLAALRQSIRRGEKEGILPQIETALTQYSPLQIAEEGLTEGMTEVGIDFGAGRCFLPQVLLAAETMKIGFDLLKKRFPKENNSRGLCLVATVQGDIHDLGKNIVAALLENSGFEVVDLGKDVSPDTVLEEAQKRNPDFIGLCALMTTTLPALEKTVDALKNHFTGPIMAGGAVLTPEYASKLEIAHAKDAIAALELAKSWTEKGGTSR